MHLPQLRCDHGCLVETTGLELTSVTYHVRLVPKGLWCSQVQRWYLKTPAKVTQIVGGNHQDEDRG